MAAPTDVMGRKPDFSKDELEAQLVEEQGSSDPRESAENQAGRKARADRLRAKAAAKSEKMTRALREE